MFEQYVSLLVLLVVPWTMLPVCWWLVQCDVVFAIRGESMCFCVCLPVCDCNAVACLSSQERREREQQELESAKEIADEDFDGFP